MHILIATERKLEKHKDTAMMDYLQNEFHLE